MPSKEILRIRNCIHITVISYFHLQLVSRSVSRKTGKTGLYNSIP